MFSFFDSLLKKIPLVVRLNARLNYYVNNQLERDAFVRKSLSELASGISILDAGSGSQRYRKYCGRFSYFSQDKAEFSIPVRPGLLFEGDDEGYKYGPLDYRGDIWSISEEDERFDAILCTEVIEHVPFPVQTLKELARLLKPGGTLILTFPGASLRHFDPYYFYSGFSDRWIEFHSANIGLKIDEIEVSGDYYRWLGCEAYRSAQGGKRESLFSRFVYFLIFLWYLSRSKTRESIDTLTLGYHVKLRKRV